MPVTRKMVVTIDYVLKNNEGKIIDSTEGRAGLSYLHGFNNIVEGLEEALEGKDIGDAVTVFVPAEKGYGLRDENLIFVVPAENFANEDGNSVEVGQEFETEINEVPVFLKVIEVNGDKVKVDANHPLAGVDLHFDAKVTAIRDSYSDELVIGYPINE